MTFSIFDSGNLVASFDDQQVAIDALAQLVHDDPETADEVVLIAFDENGEAFGEPVVGSSVRPAQAGLGAALAPVPPPDHESVR
jgi:hypothetical protein